MIDLHCHILPALDDGARDLDDAVAMARQAEADGVTRICATPHIRADHEVGIAELAERVAAVNEALAGAGVATSVLPGGEVAEPMVADLSDDELRAVSIGGGGRWILVEPGPGPLSQSLVDTVGGLGERGFRALIAHPERHLDQRSPDVLEALAGRGALIQATAQQFDEPGADILLALAARGLIHLLGSDAHSSHFGREAKLSQGVAALARVDAIAPHLGWVVHDGPAAVVAGEDAVPPWAA